MSSDGLPALMEQHSGGIRIKPQYPGGFTPNTRKSKKKWMEPLGALRERLKLDRGEDWERNAVTECGTSKENDAEAELEP